MGGTSTSTGKTEQQSQLQGWQPAMDDIQGLLGKLSPAINNISGGDPLQQGVSQLIQNAQQPNLLGAGAIDAASSLLNGGPNIGGAVGLLNRGYQGVSDALSPFLSGPIGSDPVTAAAMSTLSTDVANQVNPMFAAAGRLGSPDNYQAVARGIAQGSTGILGKAMDDRLAAASALGNAANSAASGLTGADAANAGILGQGIANAANAFGAQNLGANSSSRPARYRRRKRSRTRPGSSVPSCSSPACSAPTPAAGRRLARRRCPGRSSSVRSPAVLPTSANSLGADSWAGSACWRRGSASRRATTRRRKRTRCAKPSTSWLRKHARQPLGTYNKT